MKKAILFIVTLLLVLTGISVRAEWSPGSNELGPTKDAYVSIGGALGNPQANYGGAENMYAGMSFDGLTVSAIQFDMSKIGSAITKLTFNSDIDVYDSSTRNLYVAVFEDIDWDEFGVTGMNNPFDAMDIAYSNGNDPAIHSIIRITGSTDEITVNLDDFINVTGTITIVIAQPDTADGWVTLAAKENSYLSVFSNPPHLEFVKQKTVVATSPSIDDGGDESSDSSSAVGVLLLAGGGYWFWRRKKKKNINE